MIHQRIRHTSSRGNAWFVFALTGLFATCSPKDTATQHTQSLHDYFLSEFSHGGPGGAILIMKNGKTVFSSGYGVADLDTREPITTKTLFNIGSISKTFVANAILILHEKGKLSLDDNLLKYFPGFRNKAIAEKVKIKHLLTHTSGLPDNRQVWKDTVFYLTAGDEENWYPITQCDSLLFEPGSRFQYSNPAFNGLALIVEQVGGMKWQAFVIRHIMRPAGMDRSTITDGPHPEKGVAHGYVRNRGEWIEDDYGEEPTFPASGNGGVWSSVEELALYEKAIQKNLFLNKSSVDEARTVKTFDNWHAVQGEPNTGWSWFRRKAGSSDPFVGWSWFVTSTANQLQLIGHTGSQGGFISNYVYIPEKEIFFVILCNSPEDINALSDKVTAWLGNENWLDE